MAVRHTETCVQPVELGYAYQHGVGGTARRHRLLARRADGDEQRGGGAAVCGLLEELHRDLWPGESEGVHCWRVVRREVHPVLCGRLSAEG